ncbi:sigma-70 family RNA polymerase sigma factor [Egicoccus sp. AB-alg2]|uniref:sigma-70 family RNA polymerase sigma factor n=1 Tax=Egicoccus sp. AB-alg2 TaxID=3242693 RepID=UPI00359EB5B9
MDEPTTIDTRFERYARTGDRALRDELVVDHLPFATALARRYRHHREPLEDLQQVAALGLVKALERFDPARGVPFEAFAAPTILGELRRHFRDGCWSVSVPRPIRDRSRAVLDARDALLQELGRSPRLSEVATRAGCTVDDVVAVLDATAASRPQPLWTEPLADDPFDDPTRVEARDLLGHLVRDLPERTRRLLYLSYVRGIPQRQIAHEVGLSQKHVSRLLARALEQLRRRAA